jgi:ribosome maturation factor RimP
MEPIIEELERKVNKLVASEEGLFLVEIRIKPTNNIKVFIDGDKGVTIDQLTQLNRRLYRQIEEENMFPNGDFSLEISSPGLDEPLKLFRQYQKNIGRNVEVLMKEGDKVEGKLTAADEEQVMLEETIGKGKKTELRQHNIPFEKIKSTKVQIKF